MLANEGRAVTSDRHASVPVCFTIITYAGLSCMWTLVNSVY